MKSTKEILLTARDQLKLDLIAKIETGVLDRQTAVDTLDVSERTIRRYINAYREVGVRFILHGNRGRNPTNKISDILKDRAQDLVKRKYYDFNMSHALEKINMDLDTSIKREVFRKWCHEIGIVKRGRKRRARPRKYRVRSKQAGILLQMDGSPHKWFGGVKSCLVVVIDDATSEVVHAQFSRTETSDACLSTLRELVSKKGVFKLLYVDKAGVFGGVKRSGFSQVERALGELGSHVIFADSPQAKGRVERVFDTLQDRLIPEMRLAGIKSMKHANKYLQEIYLPQIHNPKFSCRPDSPISAYKALPLNLDLEQIFCKKEHRRVAKDHTVSFQSVRYMLDQNLEYSIAGQKIEIRIYPNGKWYAYYGLTQMKLVKIQKIEKIAA